MACGGSDIMKNLIENTKILTWNPALNSRNYNQLEKYKDSLSTMYLNNP
jgi:hypothetical protein